MQWCCERVPFHHPFHKPRREVSGPAPPNDDATTVVSGVRRALCPSAAFLPADAQKYRGATAVRPWRSPSRDRVQPRPLKPSSLFFSQASGSAFISVILLPVSSLQEFLLRLFVKKIYFIL